MINGKNQSWRNEARLKDRGWQSCTIKVRKVNIFGFPGHTISVATIIYINVKTILSFRPAGEQKGAGVVAAFGLRAYFDDF